MKIKNGFAKRNIAGSEIVVPVGKNAVDFNGMITLNESGAFFWDCLKDDTTPEEVVKKVVEVYDVAPEKALIDVKNFISMLRENGLIED
ncbi:MAG: PqqD family protein [Clostridiales bacterium]|nr:PqqD family protein [Clostridiales bacterium]